MFVLNMIWYLLLAHFLGDYPFQTDWMVSLKKHHWYGLALHIAMHTIAICIIVFLVGGQDVIIWRYLVSLLIIHLVIDIFKNRISAQYPQYFIETYFFDQLLHLISIFSVALWMNYSGMDAVFLADSYTILYVLGLVLVTDVWRITERIFCVRKYWFAINRQQAIWRMIGRAGVFVSLFTGLSLLGVLLAILSIGLLVALYWIWRDERISQAEFYRSIAWRILAVDITIATTGAILINSLMLLQSSL